MEVTKNNFADQLENITNDLNKCCFVGFDAEFTALLSGESFKYRLFDTNEERYERLKTEISKMIMTQVGLTMFQYDRDMDAYVATGYTFHLCPQRFGDMDQSFIFQASTLKFLCKHNFNFNKFIYEGIPYLSEAEVTKIRQQLRDKTLLQDLIRSLEMSEEKLLQQYCSEVSKWLTLSEDSTTYLDVESPILRYLVHNEIRLRFPNVLTTDSLGNSKKILVYRDKYVEGANSAPMAILEDTLINHVLGFSQIIYLLSASQKPIIGHNIFMDTVLLHNQFIGPLPNKYSVFKKNVNNMFPNIFDTKYISVLMGKKLSFDEVWKSNALQDLYEFFSEGKCKKLQNGVNFIKVSRPFNVKQSYHEAGWDSYCSGYCFIRLGHWAACEISGKYRPVGPTEIIAALTPFANKINIIRGAIPYMNFVENDPPSHRPELLHVKALAERGINVGKDITQAYSPLDGKQLPLPIYAWENGHSENGKKVNHDGDRFANNIPVPSIRLRFRPVVSISTFERRRQNCVTIQTLSNVFSKGMASVLASFGSIDIKPYGSRSALIAANSNATVNRILKQFKDSKEYRISTFNANKHSPARRMAIWSGALLTGSLVLYFLHKKVKVLL